MTGGQPSEQITRDVWIRSVRAFVIALACGLISVWFINQTMVLLATLAFEMGWVQ